MLCAIMQPTFLPWMGYFSMMSKVDLFVYFDDVQLAKRSWQVRNRIKTQNGELFLNIPIKKSAARDELLLCDAIMDGKIDIDLFVTHRFSIDDYEKGFQRLARSLRNQEEKERTG